jgi:hypothetical protein
VSELVIPWAPIPDSAQEGFFDDDTPDGYLLLTGGWGSGKTSALIAKMLKLSAVNYPLPGIWCVPDYNHVHDTIIPALTSPDPETGEPWFLRPDQFSYHQQSGSDGPAHRFKWVGGGQIWFVSGENADSIAGPNVAFCGTDEPGSVKQQAWRNTVARVRHSAAKLRQKVAAGTPEGLNYLADLFGPDRAEGYHVYRMDTRSNPHLPPSYLEQVMANATEAELSAYLEGKFVNMTGALAYSAFDADRQFRPDLQADEALPLRIAFDFNVDPMAVVVGQQWAGPHGVEFGALRSIAIMGSTVMDQCDAILKHYPRWPAGVVVYGDASGKNRSHQSLKSNYDIIRERLAHMGPLTLKVPTSNPAVALRVNSVNVLCRNAKGVTRLWLAGDPKKPRTAPTRELVKSLHGTIKKSGTDDIWKKPGETVSHLGEALGYWLTVEAPAQKPMMPVATIGAPVSGAGMSQTVQRIKDEKTARLRAELAAMGLAH